MMLKEKKNLIGRQELGEVNDILGGAGIQLAIQWQG